MRPPSGVTTVPSRGAFNRQKETGASRLSFSGRLFGFADGVASRVRREKYDDVGAPVRAGVGCGMCEGKVKLEGLKSINRESPTPPPPPPPPPLSSLSYRPPRSLGVITPRARSRETKGLDDKVQGREDMGVEALFREKERKRKRETWKGPKPQKRLMLFDSGIRDKLRAKREQHPRTARTDHEIAGFHLRFERTCCPAKESRVIGICRIYDSG